jgi:hypothetical protein
MAVFRRYNTIDEPDLSAAQKRVDAYLNATATKTTDGDLGQDGKQS